MTRKGDRSDDRFLARCRHVQLLNGVHARDSCTSTTPVRSRTGVWRGNTYRAVYTVRFAAAVFVLHVFQKKAKSGVATPKLDMELIRERLKAAEQVAKELSK